MRIDLGPAHDHTMPSPSFIGGKVPPEPVIFDGDMGGDDAWAILMMLAHPERFQVLGISSVFGNVDLEKATRNACQLVAYADHHHLPVFPGESGPLQGPNMLGDDAYGEDGFGGVDLGVRGVRPRARHAVRWIRSVLRRSEEKITLIATGPLTNIARVLEQEPALAAKIRRIVVMGGGLRPGPRPDVPGRSGNITLNAEFNFFQDPYAADKVAKSGLPIDFLTLDSNHHLDLDPHRRQRTRDIRTDIFGDPVVRMLDTVAHLDMAKFGTLGPTIQDPNVIMHMLQPAFYRAERGHVFVEHGTDKDDTPFTQRRHGKMHFIYDPQGPARVMTGMHQPEGVFHLMHQSLERTSRNVENRQRRHAGPNYFMR